MFPNRLLTNPPVASPDRQEQADQGPRYKEASKCFLIGIPLKYQHTSLEELLLPKQYALEAFK